MSLECIRTLSKVLTSSPSTAFDWKIIFKSFNEIGVGTPRVLLALMLGFGCFFDDIANRLDPFNIQEMANVSILLLGLTHRDCPALLLAIIIVAEFRYCHCS